MRYLLGHSGAIAITKNTTDLRSLKQMTDLSGDGRVIGIFPEGKRNWDGVTLPLIESTAKLVRLLNVPVVVPLIEGGFLMDPRWGTSFRRGRVFITYKLLFDGEKPGRKKISEIIEALKTALDHNEYTCERLKGVKFKSNKRAENIEQAVYFCPQCHAVSSFQSKGNDFTCKECQYTVHYTEEGRFISTNGQNFFDNLFEWNQWQKNKALEILKKNHGKEPLFSDDKLHYSKPDKSGSMKVVAKGSLYVFKDKLEFRDKQNNLYIYNFDGISGLNIQIRERLEFYYEKELHRFYNVEKRFSALKVRDFYNLSQSL
jgi:1-acyl-sn-glycerol-3-phosphate acyltransferase